MGSGSSARTTALWTMARRTKRTRRITGYEAPAVETVKVRLATRLSSPRSSQVSRPATAAVDSQARCAPFGGMLRWAWPGAQRLSVTSGTTLTRPEFPRWPPSSCKVGQ
jgi:hypothetical protein